jgi:RNA recognition motif-containing protein
VPVLFDIPMDNYTGLARGFGFIIFKTSSAAKHALEKDGRVQIAGRTIFVREYQRPELR